MLSKYADTSSGSCGLEQQARDLIRRRGTRSPGSRPTAASTAYGVCRKLDVLAVEQRPERALPALVRHADAAGVDEARPIDDALELHVRVPADDEALLDSRERGPKTLVGGDARQDLLVVARRAVAVEDAAERRRACGSSRRNSSDGGSSLATIHSHVPAGARGDSRSALPRTKHRVRGRRACRGTRAGTAPRRRRRRTRSDPRRATRAPPARPRARAGCRARRREPRRASGDGGQLGRAGAQTAFRRRRRRGRGSRRRRTRSESDGTRPRGSCAIASDSSPSSAGTSARTNVVETTASGRSRKW